jgi:hypothetical protein
MEMDRLYNSKKLLKPPDVTMSSRIANRAMVKSKMTTLRMMKIS